MIKMHVHIIKMGGTIEFHDPAYDEINKTLMKIDSTIDSYIKNLVKPHFNFSIETVVDKDSREITDEDRQRLADVIRTTEHINIVITHGTFTMKSTAQFLKDQKIDGKKIIVTGSMVPLAGFTVSDAGFNLGFSIASFAGIDEGVYISMNGGIFSPDDVDKNIESFRFE